MQPALRDRRLQLYDLRSATGMERKVPVHVSLSGVAKGRWIVPLLGGWSFGNTGARDCATPNLPPPSLARNQPS